MNPGKPGGANSSSSATSSTADPISLGAIQLAMAARAQIGADATIGLMGNHETMMRMTFDPATPRAAALEALTTWMMNGGERVVAEFCVEALAEPDPDRCLAMLREALPAYVAIWLYGLKSHARSGGLLFVHAGVHPQTRLDTFLAQPWNQPLRTIDKPRHWAWVRAPFLNARPGPDGFSGYLVVHGHTPNDMGRTASHEDQIQRFRLNLDAGSGLTGEVKMAILRDASAEVVTARGRRNREI